MAQQSVRIVSTPTVLGGDPRIDGTRIGVYHVHELVEGRGLDPGAVAIATASTWPTSIGR